MGRSAIALLSALLALAAARASGLPSQSRRLAAWGTPGAKPKPTKPTGPAARIVFGKISAGVFTTCGVAINGSAYCWGYNDDGQVGDNSYVTRATPTKVSGGGLWTQVSGGDWHVFGIKTTDVGYGWGYNGDKRLGNGKKADGAGGQPVPAPLPGRWRDLSAGHFHSCGVRTNGVALCWGNNKNGRLGNGLTTDPLVVVTKPQKVLGAGKWSSICAKGSHSCGRKTDGSVWCWGGNDDGEIGNGQEGVAAFATTPQQVPSPSGSWKSVACGLKFNCAIDAKDKAYCWGALRSGAVDDTVEDVGPVPKAVGGGGTWLQLSGGMQHVCGIKSTGEARCFGLGFHGQLGDGKRKDCRMSAPCAVAGGGTWREVAAGEYNTCGIKDDDAAYCWGEDVNGKHGQGKLAGFDAVPTPVAGGIKFGGLP